MVGGLLRGAALSEERPQGLSSPPPTANLGHHELMPLGERGGSPRLHSREWFRLLSLRSEVVA